MRLGERAPDIIHAPSPGAPKVICSRSFALLFASATANANNGTHRNAAARPFYIPDQSTLLLLR